MRASIALSPELSGVAAVRHFAEAALIEWQVTGETYERSRLAIAELVTNVVRHAKIPGELVIDYSDHRVRVEVSDSSPGLPKLSEPAGDAVNGRGMLIVASIVDRWGVDSTESGKIVWFEIDQFDND
ncbi:MAG: ATP-binding protein [Actinomycetes bacterium]